MPRHPIAHGAAARHAARTTPSPARAARPRPTVLAALIGALMVAGQPALAADMHWAGTSLLSNRWWLAPAWAGGVAPGAADRAVFSINVGGAAANNYALLDSNLVPLELGAVQIDATSSVLRLGNNESQRIVKLYGLDGVGARNEGANLVRFFKFTELQGSLSIEADNAAGGGFEFASGITPTGVPGHEGITLNGHTLTLNTVQAANHIGFSPGAGITGEGDVVKLGEGSVEMSGSALYNNYTGATRVLGGRFALLGDGSIEGSRHLELGAAGTFDISGRTAAASIQNLSGSGAITLGANDLNITAASGAFDGAISGSGGLRVASTDRFVLGGASGYTGATQVDSGTLVLASATALGASSAYTVAAGAVLDLAGFSQQTAALGNSGTVSLAGSRAGASLRVSGPYTSNNGLLRLGAGADASGAQTADRLILDGAAATPTGQTAIELVPLAGLGAATSGDGIEVVSALNGATTTAQTTRDAFRLRGESVAAGAYEYRLYAADASGAGENWYLRSTVVPGAAEPEVVAYRPEVPLVAAAPQQLRQADQAMLGNLNLREGTGQGAGQRASWARLISTDRISAQAGDVSPDSEGRLNGLQAGTSLWANPNWNAGFYVGQLEGDARVRGFASGVQGVVGHNDLHSQYLGLYATYRRESGFYVDSVLQGARHRASLSARSGAAAGLKGHGVLASVEVGQPLALAAGWVIEPQLQLIHHRLSLDQASLSGNTTVRSDAASGWTLRVGARVQGEWATGWGRLSPYARVNLYSAEHGTDLAAFGTGGGAATVIHTRTGGTSAELALGATLAASKALSVYGELGQLWAQGGPARSKSGLSASLGLRWGW